MHTTRIVVHVVRFGNHEMSCFKKRGRMIDDSGRLVFHISELADAAIDPELGQETSLPTERFSLVMSGGATCSKV